MSNPILPMGLRGARGARVTADGMLELGRGDVAEYGADPASSATVNATAINEALAAGYDVFLPAGTHEVNATIVVPAGVRFSGGSGRKGAAAGAARGATLRWTGSAGGTVVQVTGADAEVRNMTIDASLLADVCVDVLHAEGVELANLGLHNFMGTVANEVAGLVVGDGVANNNDFCARRVRIVGKDGACGVIVNASASENVRFEQCTISATGPDDSHLERALWLRLGNVSMQDLIVDRVATGEYAIVKNGGSISIKNGTFETSQVFFGNGGQNRGSTFEQCDFRSGNVDAGEYIINWSMSGAGDYSLTLIGCRINRLEGSTYAPNVYVNNGALISLGTNWDATIGEWAADTVYAVNDLVTNGADTYQCTAGGTSDSSGGPSGTGTGIADNECVWDYTARAQGQFAPTSTGAVYDFSWEGQCNWPIRMANNVGIIGRTTTGTDVTLAKVTGSDNAQYGLGATDTYLQATDDVFVDAGDGTQLRAKTGGKLLFYGAGTAATKPEVTGAAGGNAALESLLDQLAAIGLITKSTT